MKHRVRIVQLESAHRYYGLDTKWDYLAGEFDTGKAAIKALEAALNERFGAGNWEINQTGQYVHKENGAGDPVLGVIE